MAKFIAVLIAFLIGVITSPVAAYLWFLAANKCVPGPGDPCDGGPILVAGLAIVLAPILGTLFATITFVCLRRRAQRNRGEA